ncbi:hypothetical protein ACWGKU_29385 [Kitasatospora sp. NPDC054768]
MRTKKALTYYLATRPDGTVLTHATGPTPIPLLSTTADGIVHHPTPGEPGHWYGGGHFILTTAPGEALHRLWTWPVRLFTVEPVGESERGGRYAGHTLMTRALRVVEETDAHKVFGPRGRQVLEHLDAVPGLARRWAADWATDPDGKREAYETWRLCTHHEHTSGRHAVCHAGAAAGRSHREAADTTAERIAIRRAIDAAEAAGADRGAVHYAAMRASHTTSAVLLEDRLSEYILTALRGTTLDLHPTATSH